MFPPPPCILLFIHIPLLYLIDRDFFQGFYQSTTISRVYDYLEGPFYDIIYGKRHDDEIFRPGYILGHNVIVGAIRISQLRVRYVDCFANRMQQRIIQGASCQVQKIDDECPNVENNDIESIPGINCTCVPPFSTTYMSDTPFGRCGLYRPGLTYSNGSYDPNVKSEESSFKGNIGIQYVAPNFMFEIPSRETCLFNPSVNETVCAVKSIIDSLRQNQFIDRRTSVVYIDMVIYNPNLDRICTVRMSFEIPITGGVIPSININNQRVYAYHTGLDYIRLLFEIVVYGFVLFWLPWEVKKIILYKKQYFYSFTNMMHLLNTGFFLLSFFLQLKTFQYPSLQDVVINEDKFYNFRDVMLLQLSLMNVNSVNVFLCWIKVCLSTRLLIFKYKYPLHLFIFRSIFLLFSTTPKVHTNAKFISLGFPIFGVHSTFWSA